MPKSMPKKSRGRSRELPKAPENSEPGSWPALRGTLPDIQREASTLETLHWSRGHVGGYSDACIMVGCLYNSLMLVL